MTTGTPYDHWDLKTTVFGTLKTPFLPEMPEMPSIQEDIWPEIQKVH